MTVDHRPVLTLSLMSLPSPRQPRRRWRASASSEKKVECVARRKEQRGGVKRKEPCDRGGYIWWHGAGAGVKRIQTVVVLLGILLSSGVVRFVVDGNGRAPSCVLVLLVIGIRSWSSDARRAGLHGLVVHFLPT
jgi:hypothetical protein